MKLTVYGSRGSIPFAGSGASDGGNTSCMKLDINGRTVILDCGSGLMQFRNEILRPVRLPGGGGSPSENKLGHCFDILLSHLHIDHTIGLSMFDPLFDPANKIRVFTKSRSALPLSSQVFGAFKPPYWPVDLSAMNRAELVEVKTGEPFPLGGGVTVTAFDSCHEDQATGFRIEGEKTAVYLLDCEIRTDGVLRGMAGKCKDADIVIFDATYLPQDYPAKAGWGHSTYEMGMRLAEASGCKRMLFSHFCHSYSGEQIRSIKKGLRGGSAEYFTAFDGMEIEI